MYNLNEQCVNQCVCVRVLNSVRMVHWTYSSSCSSAISVTEGESAKHNRSSISSVIELARFLASHGGLLNLQHVPPPSQTWPSQSLAFGKKRCIFQLFAVCVLSHYPQKEMRGTWCCHYHMDIYTLASYWYDFQCTSH